MKAFNLKRSIRDFIPFHLQNLTTHWMSIFTLHCKTNVQLVSSTTDAGQLDIKSFEGERVSPFFIIQKIIFSRLYTLRKTILSQLCFLSQTMNNTYLVMKECFTSLEKTRGANLSKLYFILCFSSSGTSSSILRHSTNSFPKLQWTFKFLYTVALNCAHGSSMYTLHQSF